jgi:hypothetical protein
MYSAWAARLPTQSQALAESRVTSHIDFGELHASSNSRAIEFNLETDVVPDLDLPALDNEKTVEVGVYETPPLHDVVALQSGAVLGLDAPSTASFEDGRGDMVLGFATTVVACVSWSTTIPRRSARHVATNRRPRPI